MLRLAGVLALCLCIASPSWSAVTVVNEVVASTASATSLTTGTFNATAGNTLVVGACVSGEVGLTITTSGSDTAANIDSGNSTPGLNTPKTVYFTNIAGGASYTVTVTPGGGTRKFSLFVIELGTVTASSFDVGAANPNTPATTTPNSGTTAATAQADEIAVGFICSDSTAAPASFTAGTGYTLSNTVTDGSTKMVSAMEYKILSSTGTQTASWTTDSATARASIGTFKASAGTPDQTHGFRLRVIQ